ncbi:MAG: ACP S-malonyltransferase, partial [Phycisphaerales bacterium]|nr:ACP S-malonyltransferase [Phycisphaerales bacterium]
MSGSKVLLLPGQGAQVVGMAKAWVEASPEARAVFAEADAALAGHLPALPGTGGTVGAARHEREATLSELCFNGPAELLNRTDVSQPAIYAAGVACWRGLLARWGVGQNAGISEAGVVATAGLSLGEYTALHIAGAFSFADGLKLVALRGRAMQDAAEASRGGGGGMVALIGADEAQAQQVCDETLAAGVSAGVTGEVLVCANFNAPGQIVIAGNRGAVERAIEAAKSR